MDSAARDALDAAGRALRHRDLSASALRTKLRGKGIGETLAEETVERLADYGLVDDARTAASRAQALAGRGYGNRAIDARLERDGFDRTCREAALDGLETEESRAAAIVSRASGRDLRRVAASLERRGFGFDAIESALARVDASREPELR